VVSNHDKVLQRQDAVPSLLHDAQSDKYKLSVVKFTSSEAAVNLYDVTKQSCIITDLHYVLLNNNNKTNLWLLFLK
jgi:Mg-chelatase subunit ChlD